MQTENPIILTNLSTALVDQGNDLKEVLVEKQALDFGGFYVVQDRPVDEEPRVASFHSHSQKSENDALAMFEEKQSKGEIVADIWEHDECVKIRKLLYRIEISNVEKQYMAIAKAKRMMINICLRSKEKGYATSEDVKQVIDELQPVFGKCYLSPAEWYYGGDTAVLGCYEARIYRRNPMIISYMNRKENTHLKHFRRNYENISEMREDVVKMLISLSETGDFPNETNN